MFGVILQCFDWMPRPLTIICCGVVLVFVIVCLGHIIRSLVDMLLAIKDLFGGLLDKVVGLFR